MNLYVVAAIIASFVVNTLTSCAYAEEIFAINVQSKGTGQEEVYVNRIPASEIKASPSCIVEESNPPLSIKQAVENARVYLKANFPDFEKAEVVDVIIDDFLYYNELRDKWYYLVIFGNIPPTPSKPEPFSYNSNGNIRILVMMDGRVPEITTEKRGQRQQQVISDRVSPATPTPSAGTTGTTARSVRPNRPSKPIDQ